MTRSDLIDTLGASLIGKGWIAEVNEKSASIRILGVQGDPMRARSSDGRGEIVVVDCAAADDEQPFAPMLDERVSYAHLIAAAPELLRELDHQVRNCPVCKGTGKAVDVFDILTFDGPHDEKTCRRCESARAAIAKAEGRS